MNKRAPSKSTKGFAAQVRSYGKKLRLPQSDITDYIQDSRAELGRKVPMGKSLKKDMRLYKSAIYD